MSELVVCAPELYYSAEVQSFVKVQRTDPSKTWIFQLIDGTYNRSEETVLLSTADWVLCIDRHPGSDRRYLVVFKDRTLHTIRDLRQCHVAMLIDMQRQVLRKLKEIDPRSHAFQWFFHYFPSVFQLHLHISSRMQSTNVRVQKLRHVLRNLLQDTMWYHDALLLTSRNKMVKTIAAYVPVPGLGERGGAEAAHEASRESAESNTDKPLTVELYPAGALESPEEHDEARP